MTGRPIAAAPAGAWQGGQGGHGGYHYPGQTAPEHGQQPAQHYAPAAPQQHYQPMAPRTQTGGHAADPASTLARYSGAPEAPSMPQGYVGDQYQPPRAAPANAQTWQPAAAPQHAQYAQPGAAEPHWPGERVPYQNVTTGEPRTGYETNGYLPPQYGQDVAHANGQYQPAAYADPQAGYGQQQHAGYQDGAYAPQYAPEHGYDPRTGQPYANSDGYAQGYGQPGTALDAGQPIAGNDGNYETDYDEAPPRKRRGLLVAGALVCAVAVGGGLAFVYKTFGPRDKRIGAPPVVAKASTPAKVAPADPQGKQFDNTNKKILARHESTGSTSSAPTSGNTPMVPGMIVSMPPPANATPAAAENGSPSTRTVQTVPIGRDGNPVGGGQPPVVTPRGLPGVQIDNSLNTPPAMRGAIPAAEAPPPPAAKPQAQRLAATPPPATEPAAAPVGAAPKAKTAVPKREPATPAAATTAGPAGASGYVAVLSSQKDRASALRIYADLAQKYPGQLGSRQPEVQEAQVADKGVYQRLVVGPPSSQQSAKDLCSQLKAAGHTGDCWVKQY